MSLLYQTKFDLAGRLHDLSLIDIYPDRILPEGVLATGDSIWRCKYNFFPLLSPVFILRSRAGWGARKSREPRPYVVKHSSNRSINSHVPYSCYWLRTVSLCCLTCTPNLFGDHSIFTDRGLTRQPYLLSQEVHIIHTQDHTHSNILAWAYILAPPIHYATHPISYLWIRSS